jgi:hypothetical protein
LNDGLEGLTGKETKLASYWNTPFNKICLGMKINNYSTKWIMIDHQASSLFKLIKDTNFTSTSVGVKAWESLDVHQSYWEEHQMRGYQEGFNFYNKYVYARIGFALKVQCRDYTFPFLGLGISFHTVEEQVSSI